MNLLRKSNLLTSASSVLVLAGLALLPAPAHAQAAPTAVASFRLSGFVGVGGNFTGLGVAKNGDVVAGIDLGFRPFASFYPSVEIRGMYSVATGNVISYKNGLAGLKLERHRGPLAGYGNALVGRGGITYGPHGYPTPTGSFIVLTSTSNVLSLGGGCDYRFSEHVGLKGDFQFQTYGSPVTASGSLYSKVFTVGVVYHVGSGSVR